MDIPTDSINTINKDQKSISSGVMKLTLKIISSIQVVPGILKSKAAIFLAMVRKRKILENTNANLKKTVQKLKKENLKIVRQQKTLIEKERINVLLQMAGAKVYELNQPLMSLLSGIELMELDKEDPDKLAHHISLIKKSGYKISEVVKKIQTIRHDETRQHFAETSIVDIDQKINILSLEDSDDDFEMINTVLSDQKQISLSRSSSIEDAVQVLKQNRFDLILLDYLLSDGNGLDLLKRMEREGLEIPAVVITGQGDEMIAKQVIQAGAYDYLPKNKIGDESLLRVLISTLEKARLKKEIKNAQEKIAMMSIRDELTELYNRRYFNEVIEKEVSRAIRYENDLVLCMIDLDYFKKINDTYGHLAGDITLSEIAGILKKCVRKSDMCCRYGGEEFTVIMTNTGIKGAKKVSERFRKMVAKRLFKYNTSKFHCTVSVGIAAYNFKRKQSSTELLEASDIALYQAKAQGRNRIVTTNIIPRAN
ncbi:MAG: diguanylate cyclase [Deltaproteobacteria bacterium]|nr:diguanylate cyclase [Deltaproteobacteria bacterium]